MDEIMGEIMIAACGMGTAEPSPCETPAQCRDGGCARLRARDVAQVAEVAAETRIRVLDAPAPRDPVAARRASLAIAVAFLDTRPSPEQLLEFAEGYGATPIVANERIPKGSIVAATKNGDAVAFPFDAENRTIAEPWSITDRLRRIEGLLTRAKVGRSGDQEVDEALLEVRSILGGE